MGKHNLAVNQFLERKDIFADLINGSLFDGEQVLEPAQLTLRSSAAGVLQERENGSRLAAIERRGDIRMEADLGTYSVILANETQQKVHLGMPVRNMLYDALEYTKQLQELEKKHKEAGDKLINEEYLSGITREDRLQPVITTVLFCNGEWNGAECLYDLLGIDTGDEKTESIRRYLPDYRINLIQPEKMENLNNFKTCLQQIFHMIKYKSDKSKFDCYIQEHQKEIGHMDRLAVTAAFELMGESKMLHRIEQLSEGKGEEDMSSIVEDVFCKVFAGKTVDEAREEGMEKGMEKGIEKGIESFGLMIDGLISEGREYLIPTLSKDEKLRKELYSKYCV